MAPNLFLENAPSYSVEPWGVPLSFQRTSTTSLFQHPKSNLLDEQSSVMPLTEISPNVRRPRSHSQAAQSLRKCPTATKTATSLAPDGVQRMLRTSTETGDIGQFSVRPSRLPRSGSRALATRRRSGSFDSSFPLARPRHRSRGFHIKPQINNGPRQMPSSSTLSRQDTIRSSLTSYHNNPRARPRNARLHRFAIEGMVGPPVGPHGLYSHRSLMTLRSQGGFSSVSSNSPLGHAGRTRRQGYRAISPAYSDVLASDYSLQPHYHGSTSVDTATSSPISALSRPAGVPGYSPYMTSSLASFRRFPSPAVQPPYYSSRRPVFPTRTNTPASLSTLGLQRSLTGSTIPQYYDYTESFAEEDYLSSDVDASATALHLNMDQTASEHRLRSISRRPQTPHNTMSRSAFHPAELSTIHRRTASEQSKQSFVANVPDRSFGRKVSTRSKTLMVDQKVSTGPIENVFANCNMTTTRWLELTRSVRCLVLVHNMPRQRKRQKKTTPADTRRLHAEPARPLLPVLSFQMPAGARVI